MEDHNTAECLNCHKVGCHGVRHRMCTDKKGTMPRLVTECQWCEARLVVKGKHTWIEYAAIVMLFTPLALLEYWPQASWVFSALIVVLALALIIWAKWGVSYQLAHRVEPEFESEAKESGKPATPPTELRT